MSYRMRIGCVILLLCATVRGQAQAQVQAPTPAPSQIPSPELTASEPLLKTNPMHALRNFEPAADEPYRLGSGDEITVGFAGRPEMQAKRVLLLCAVEHPGTPTPGRIVNVTRSGFSRLGVMLQKLSPLMTLATMAIVEANRW